MGFKNLNFTPFLELQPREEKLALRKKNIFKGHI